MEIEHNFITKKIKRRVCYICGSLHLNILNNTTFPLKKITTSLLKTKHRILEEKEPQNETDVLKTSLSLGIR